MPDFDPAFSCIKPTNYPIDGLKIWRIKNFELTAVDEKEYGTFYEGDAYLIYYSGGEEENRKIKLFIWLGKCCSQDESGTAAVKMVELDELLDGYNAQQHRECQNNEDCVFKRIFSGKNIGGKSYPLKYKRGGHESGFRRANENDVDDELDLLQIKGKTHIEISEVPVSESSLNQGDCFILRKGRRIFYLKGISSTFKEQQKSLAYVQHLKAEVENKSDGRHVGIDLLEQSVLLDKTKTFGDLPCEYQEFCKCLGLNNRKPSIKEASAGGDDSVPSKCTLYRVCDESSESEESNTIKMKEVGTTPLSRSLLDTKDSYILEAPYQIFVWKGKGASSEERKFALNRAQGFRKEKDLPENISISVEVEGHESPVFKGKFYDWPEIVSVFRPSEKYNIAKIEKRRFDFATLHQNRQKPKQKMFDDGKGKVQVWRVVDFAKEEVPESDYGTFYSGDCYIILYSYKRGNQDQYVIYYWLGDKSTGDERSTASILTVELDQSLGDIPVQVRVVQGKEPDHFMLIFKGTMTVLKGGAKSGFRNVQESQEKSSKRLFRVRWKKEFCTKVIEVDVTASSLTSNDCFVLETPRNCYIWFGKNCTGDEHELARKFAAKINRRESLNFCEGKEPQEFWDELGGKKPYVVEKEHTEELIPHSPRLFQVSNSTGNFKWEEIFDFDQDDMDEDDIMILDTFDTIYIWVGSGARCEEKSWAVKTISEYLAHDPAARNPDDTMTMIIKQGNEPPLFTHHFETWDSSLFEKKKQDHYALRNSIIEENKLISSADLEKTIKIKRYYPKAVLEKKEGLPEDVDVNHKEQWLDDREFEALFKMSKSDFKCLKGWQQQNKKKAVDLY